MFTPEATLVILVIAVPAVLVWLLCSIAYAPSAPSYGISSGDLAGNERRFERLTGPNGGVYRYNSKGEKVYVNRKTGANKRSRNWRNY